MRDVTDKQVEAARLGFTAHTWDAASKTCACGLTFEATTEGHAAHSNHQMRAALEEALLGFVWDAQADSKNSALPKTADDKFTREQMFAYWDAAQADIRRRMRPMSGAQEGDTDLELRAKVLEHEADSIEENGGVAESMDRVADWQYSAAQHLRETAAWLRERANRD